MKLCHSRTAGSLAHTPPPKGKNLTLRPWGATQGFPHRVEPRVTCTRSFSLEAWGGDIQNGVPDLLGCPQKEKPHPFLRPLPSGHTSYLVCSSAFVSQALLTWLKVSRGPDGDMQRTFWSSPKTLNPPPLPMPYPDAPSPTLSLTQSPYPVCYLSIRWPQYPAHRQLAIQE